MLSRRELLTTGATTLLSAGLVPSALAAGYVNGDLSRSLFLSKLGGGFWIWAGLGVVRVKLFDVVDGPPDPRVEQFTAVFRSGLGLQLPEGTYYLWDRSHTCRLHLQPAGFDDDGASYHSAAIAHLL